MATSGKLVALVLMSTVSLICARPSLDAAERQHVWPHWRDAGMYDYKYGLTAGRQSPPGLTSPAYVEPSSRDLDIGFTVGRDDDDVEKHTYTSGGPIRSGYVVREGYRDTYPEDVDIGVFTEGPVSSYATSGAAEGGWSRSVYPRGDRVDGYPGVIAQPLDYKVGELKLRSDRGYQLSMHVPPSSVGDRPGVLKIDMKATLYKPIYY